MASFVVSDAQSVSFTLSDFESGIITGTGSIVSATSFSPGVTITGDAAKLIVEGDILRQMSAVAGAGTISGATVSPIGLTLAVGEDAALRTLSGDAVSLAVAASLSLTNEGAIGGGNTLFTSGGTQDGDAVYASGISGSVAEIVNGGVLSGIGGVELVNFKTVSILNDGTIRGSSNVAIEVTTIRSDATFGLVNAGLVTAAVAGRAISVTGAAATIENHGMIIGSVVLSSGNDRYLGAAGVLSGTVFGGVGNDLLVGGWSEEKFYGGIGNDSIRGGGGSDEIVGVNGDDVLRGGGDADVLRGDAGNDVLRGDGDDDMLQGGDGNDDLFGGADDDLIQGDAGSDDLTGGAGADAFYFRVATDSTLAASDTILDFQRGTDLIDISNVTTGTADFNGTDGFFEGADEAQVTYSRSGNNVIVRVDRNGGGTEDMRFLVLGVTELSAADFML